MPVSALLRVVRTARARLSALLYQHRKIVAVLLACSIVFGSFYLIEYTPLPVYILDRLNLRPFFLPKIACRGCNNFSYAFMVDNRNFCSPTAGARPPSSADDDGGREIFLLILVATFHANADARRAIRKSWGSVREYRGRSIRTLFLFGRHDDPNYNYQVQYELEHYGDVVQVGRSLLFLL
jgi:hypothetical protein